MENHHNLEKENKKRIEIKIFLWQVPRLHQKKSIKKQKASSRVLNFKSVAVNKKLANKSENSYARTKLNITLHAVRGKLGDLSEQTTVVP